MYCRVYNLNFHSEVRAPQDQVYKTVPETRLMLHEVLVCKNIFRDCVKHVKMQRCHITVARWVKAFREGRDAIWDDVRTRQYHVENITTQLLAPLEDVDRRWTAHELAAEIGVCHKTVLHILHDILGYRKLAALWIPHENSEVQQWHRYPVAQALFDRYQREGDDFLERIVAMNETWARSTGKTWNANQINGSIPVLLFQRKCALHNVL